MTSTPPATAPTGNNKPSLTGARIKQRKGVVKSQAKFEPEEFRDSLFKHLEVVSSSTDWDAYASTLDRAGNTLDYRKYADQLFEILIVGGLLAPGGTFVDDDAPPSPFSIFSATEANLASVKPYITVIDKVIRRYKFLQKTLEDSTLRGILQYINRFSDEQRSKLAIGVAVMIQMNLATAGVLVPLQKDHLTKDGLSLNFVSQVFRTYLQEQSMDHLGPALRKGGVRDVLAFFPSTKRAQEDVVASHFRSAEVKLPAVADWYQKRALKEARDGIVVRLAELRREGEERAAREAEEAEEAVPAADVTTKVVDGGAKNGNDEAPPAEAQPAAPVVAGDSLVRNNAEIVVWLGEEKKRLALKDEDFILIVWEGLMKAVDWSSSRSDQIEAHALKEVNKNTPILEKFTPNPRAEIALINAIQVYCYEDTRIIKVFPNILKVLYNRDVISDAAILYWAQKGARPQGKQHFLKATEPLVQFLQQQDSDDDDDDE